MQEISDKTNETVYLGIPNEGMVVYLMPLSERHYSIRSCVGEKLHDCTASKAMLACFDDTEIDAI